MPWMPIWGMVIIAELVARTLLKWMMSNKKGRLNCLPFLCWFMPVTWLSK